MNRSQVLAFAVGPIGAALLGSVSLPLSTWLFGAADIGRIAMLQTLTSLSIILFGLGLDQSYLREFHQAKDGRALFRMAMAPGLLLLATTAVVVLGFMPGPLAQAIFGIDSAYLAWAVVGTIGTAYCSRYFSLILRMQERGLAFSMSQLLPKLVFLGALLLFYLSQRQHTFDQLLLAHVSGLVVAMLIFAWNTHPTWLSQSGQVDPNAITLPGMLRYGSPLMVAGLAFWGLETMDKVSLRILSSFAELGTYSVAVGLASVAGTLSVLFTTIWIPTAYRWAGEADCARRIEDVAHKLVAMGGTLVSVAGAFTWTLQYLLPAEYAAVQYLLCVCMVPPVLYAMAEVTGIGAGIARKNLPVMLIALAACAINLVGNLVLIPLLGASGAAVSTAVAFFAMFIMRTEVSIGQWAAMSRSKLYLPMAAITLFSVLYALTGPRFPKAWTGIWHLCAVAYVVFNRTILTDLFRQLTAKKTSATGAPNVLKVKG